MRIVIDLQGAQSTGSRHRGIGRYSLSLAQAIARNRGAHEVLIVLSDLFVDTIEPIRIAFDGLLPQENIRVWKAPGPVAELHLANTSRRLLAESIREAFLATLQPDMVLVTSLFEGLSDDAVTSLKSHAALPTAVVLYDLIPLIHHTIYLSNPAVDGWYRSKLEHLKRAALLLSISASSGQEAVDWLGFDKDRVANISTACDAHFSPVTLAEAHHTRLRDQYGLRRAFVMYTGGVDHRKNIDSLIRAYAKLPKPLRQSHQLAVVCSVQPPERQRLEQLAREAGLGDDEFVMTGFVPEDDLITLYNACKLFVFPSWHEGFGLPALEAMQCGKAVIAANTSSLPEVVGRNDALFNPHDEASITAKMEQALQDEDFRRTLEQHGPEQASKFTWDITAKRAIAAMERWQETPSAASTRHALPVDRPRLAYVSPLPPERSGISDYSAELLRVLSHWYTVDVIVDQAEVSDEWIKANCAIRDVAFFRANHRDYGRVLYHFGNSQFHQHMFDLLADVPGVVVLHDFFLSGILAHRDLTGLVPYGWAQDLQVSHGYHAVRERYAAADVAEVIWAYPCNLPVLQTALGMIVHSENSRHLADRWYGTGTSTDWSVIPLMRARVHGLGRNEARKALGLQDDEFVICSFGLLGPTKLNHRLLEAFLQSPLAQDPKTRLVFVGENHGGDYGQRLIATIRESGLKDRIRITGWADDETFRRYLASADVGVQLRTLSRGETSAAVLDCMNHGLATVVNAHGSMADLDPHGVWLLPDVFSNEQFAEALTTLWRDGEYRKLLGGRAREIIETRHEPRACAARYAQAIETIYQRATDGLHGVVQRLARPPIPSDDVAPFATVLAQGFPPQPRRRQLLVDVSDLMQGDASRDAERVTRPILREWLLSPPDGWSVEPVYAMADIPGYRYARRFTCRFLGMDESWAEDLPADAWVHDAFIGLDLQPAIALAQEDFLKAWHRRGVDIRFVIYDLPLIPSSDGFVDDEQSLRQRWIEFVTRFDGAVCISQAVAEDLQAWVSAQISSASLPFDITCLQLGGDIGSSNPTWKESAKELLQAIKLAQHYSTEN